MNTRWKPHVTVAAVIERDGLFLLVEEETADGLRLNNPAGHLDCGETPEQAANRELKQILDANDIQLGGLKVYTTLDAAWQNRLEEELTRAVEDLEKEKSWPHPTEANHVSGTEPDYLQYAAVTTELKTGAT